MSRNPELSRRPFGRPSIIAMSFPEKSREILVTLTHKVRYLSAAQISETWWSDTESGKRQARKKILELCRSGLVEQRAILSHPMLPLSGPVIEWEPRFEAPHFGRAAYQLQSRWKDPERQQTIYFATKVAVKRFGGVAGGLVLAHQVTHDLHVTQMYLSVLSRNPELAERWTPEFLLKPFLPKFSKTPDAAFLDSDREIGRILEFGGRYDARRVARFHEYCAKYKYAYELW